MMNLTADNLRRRWRLPWPRRSGVGRTRRNLPPADTAHIEKSIYVLEEIWRLADRTRPKANFALRLGLLSKLRATLAGWKVDLFGACLCCKATLGLRLLTATPWAALCVRCQEAADRDNTEVLRIRSRG
jgi:RNA polymerase-binding transcription factor DksA